jgi:hypothetical protein
MKVPNGFYRRPDLDYHMHRDDYILTALALHYGKEYHECANEYLDHVCEHRSLGGKGIWSPHHTSYFDRICEPEFNPAKAEDFTMYASAFSTPFTEGVCETPPNNTSDKLLMSAMFIINREIKPSYYSDLTDYECHQMVDYNDALDVYYGTDHPLGNLLKGLL